MALGLQITLLAEINVMFYMQDVKGQCWTDEESDGENEPEQFLYGIQVKKHSTENQTITLYDNARDQISSVSSTVACCVTRVH